MKKDRKYLLIILPIMVLLGIIVLKNSFATSMAWYDDYTYVIDEENSTITLTKYNGSSTEVLVPATATIDDKTYNVIVVGGSTSKALFSNNENITKVTFENGVKGGASLNYMFYQCSNLSEVIFNNFDTSNTTSMLGMFSTCTNLRTLDLTAFDTRNVTTMARMFQNCSNLRELNMSSFTSENLDNIHLMFNGTSKLKKIYLGNFNFQYNNGNINGYPFSRGTWKRLEDGKNYAAVDIAYKSSSSDISGTYVYQSNVIDEMFVKYSVKYRIDIVSKIDEYSFSNNDLFMVNGNALYLKNLHDIQTSDYVVSGSATLLLKNVVTDANGNKSNLRIKVDNIHLYDLHTELPDDKNYATEFNHMVLTVGNGAFSLSNSNYLDDLETVVNSNRPVKYDLTLEVVDDNGVVQEGDYIFSARDLDVPSGKDVRDNTVKYPYSDVAGWGIYSEGINFLEGFDSSTLKLYSHTQIKEDNEIANRIFGTHYDEGTEFSEFLIRVDAEKFKFTWTGEDCSTSVLKNYQPVFVEFIKQDNHGNSLAGAELELYSGEELIDSWTSTNVAHKLFLNVGRYTLKEKTVPTNYTKANDIEFYVDIDGNITIAGETYDNVVMKDVGKPVSVIVKHIDSTTNEELNRVTDNNQRYGDSYTSSAKSFTGYVLERKPTSETVTLNQDETVIEYYYTKAPASVVEKHIDINSNELLYEEVHNGRYGDDYNILSKIFTNYVLVTDQLPTNSSGKMTGETIEVIYYYQRVVNITTEVEGIGGTIIGDETINYNGDSTPDNIVIEADSDHYIDKITINGVEITVTDDRKMVLDKFVGLTENKHIVVTFGELVADIPKTDMNTIFPIIGVGMLVVGLVFVYLADKKKKRLTV